MKKLFIISIIALIAFSSCNKQGFQRIVKSQDYDLKYEKAMELYAAEKYSKAMQLFEQLVPYYRGQTKGEEVYFYMAMCNFEVKDYILAGYYFSDFANSYKMSEFHEEALFLSAYCYYLDAPKWSLDQHPTHQAILEFHLFMSIYPRSERIDTCNILVDELRYKLQTKSYKNAKLYYDIGYYKSASLALNNSLKDYSDSPFKEEILYYDYKASFDYATKSVRYMQEERYTVALDKYHTYASAFPDGKYIDDVEKIHKKIDDELVELKSKDDKKVEKRNIFNRNNQGDKDEKGKKGKDEKKDDTKSKETEE